MVNDYRELDVWQMSMSLCEKVYALIRSFPAEERFALCDQLRRAVVSIPSNIAEGAERQSVKEFCQFLYIAKGSSAELRTQLYIAARIGVISNEKCTEFTSRCKSIAGQIQKLISSLEASRG